MKAIEHLHSLRELVNALSTISTHAVLASREYYILTVHHGTSLYEKLYTAPWVTALQSYTTLSWHYILGPRKPGYLRQVAAMQYPP